jgi:hypothetical protein
VSLPNVSSNVPPLVIRCCSYSRIETLFAPHMLGLSYTPWSLCPEYRSEALLARLSALRIQSLVPDSSFPFPHYYPREGHQFFHQNPTNMGAKCIPSLSRLYTA